MEFAYVSRPSLTVTLPSITPLTARSVAVEHAARLPPPALPISALVKVGELFGIADRATRVCLTRMVKDGDVTVDNGVYRLSERLLRRQGPTRCGHVAPHSAVDWGWEMAIVTSTTRPLAERVALRKSMCGTGWASCARGCGCGRITSLVSSTGSSPTSVSFSSVTTLTRRAWQRRSGTWPGWAAEAHRLLTVLDQAESLAEGFMATAEVIPTLLLDPYLPDELLPAAWPGDRLRERYSDFNANYSASPKVQAAVSRGRGAARACSVGGDAGSP